MAVGDACLLRKPGLVCFACFFLRPFPLLCMPLASAGYPGILAEGCEAEGRNLLDADDWEELTDGENGPALTDEVIQSWLTDGPPGQWPDGPAAWLALAVVGVQVLLS